MTADPAARWRAGRDGYGRHHKLVVGPIAPEYRDAVQRVADALSSKACHYRHGRAGALYCGSGDAPSWTGVRTGGPHG